MKILSALLGEFRFNWITFDVLSMPSGRATISSPGVDYTFETGDARELHHRSACINLIIRARRGGEQV